MWTSQLRVVHARLLKVQHRSAASWLVRWPKDAVSKAVVRRCYATPAGGLLVRGKSTYSSGIVTYIRNTLVTMSHDPLSIV